ncbi:MAG: efflux RND transporter periplasmic adaptor subunit [Alphaproteobacteria bacterium]|nr:efflux RND transporter periplasmic adaptor subunit [Alphaproteobacteria bacterium]NCB49587.1 efflux RND transporter periplasmic adaptor subunit [Alphaproteobacteria bacterium]
MNNVIKALSFLLLFGVLTACHEEKGQMATPQMMKLKAVAVRQENIFPVFDYVAKIESKEDVALKARVQGFLEKRFFKEGSFVKKGDLLFQIEADQYESKVQQAEANVLKAKANVKNAEIQYTRSKNLYKTKNLAKSRLDDAIALFQTAKAEVSQAEALLDLAKKDLEYTKIFAPISGRIGKSTYSDGELISPSSGMLARVVSVDPIYASFSVSENEITNIQEILGDNLNEYSKAEVSFKWSNGKTYPENGKISFVDVVLDEQMNTLELRAEFPNPNHILIPGQFGRAVLKKTEPVLKNVVPQLALQQDVEGNYLYVIQSDGSLLKKRVIAGMEVGQNIVIDGVKAGDIILLEGFQKVSPKSKISPVLPEENKVENSNKTAPIEEKEVEKGSVKTPAEEK